MSIPKRGEIGKGRSEKESEIIEPLERSSFEYHVQRLISSEGKCCLRFSSAEGGHFVQFLPETGFRAVYAGPHGPENRPAKINLENLERLFNQSENVEFVDIENSPYQNSAVMDYK